MCFTEKLCHIYFLWLSQNFICFLNPFFQCRNGALHTSDHTIGCFYPAIQFSCLGTDTFLFHLANMRTLMHGRYHIQALIYIRLMRDAALQSFFFKSHIYHVRPCSAPHIQRFRPAPVCSRNGIKFPLSVFFFYSISILIQTIYSVLFCSPCSIFI